MESAGYQLVEDGGFWRCAALFRGGINKTSLSINKQTGDWIDFGSGKRGSPEDLAKILTNQETSFDYETPIDMSQRVKTTKFFSEDVFRAALPIYEFFIKQRGISEQTLKTFEAGYLQSGDMYRRITFPIRNSRGIIGMAGRWFQESPPRNKPKWKIIGPKKEFIYARQLNEKIIDSTKQIILLEGLTDFLKLWDSGIKQSIPLFGLNLSPKQLGYILAKNPNQIFLGLNNDENKDFNSGKEAARKLQTKLLKHFNSNQIIFAPPLNNANDFGCQDPDDIVEWGKKYEITRV